MYVVMRLIGGVDISRDAHYSRNVCRFETTVLLNIYTCHIFQFDSTFYQYTFLAHLRTWKWFINFHMVGSVAHLDLYYMANICSIHESINV